MRNSFSEFELGKIKTWADKNHAQMIVNSNKTVVQVVRGNSVLLHWQYGFQMLFVIYGTYYTWQQLVVEMEHLNQALMNAFGTIFKNLNDAFNNDEDDEE